MRALRVLGLAEDSDNLVCEDGTTGELFTVPSDERLRAAVRGDLSRLGQLQIELEPQLRPREIQARIRAGASVAQVATAANTSVTRIERYAYPVMLERSTMAEKARRAHPMIDGNPARKTLEELVSSTLARRGQDGGMQWDAYRDETGWVVTLRWQAGRSENSASWDIHAGGRTNTLRARDDAARELLDPAPRPLRTIAETASGDSDPHSRAEPGPVATDVVARETARRSDDALAGLLSASGSRHPVGTRRPAADRMDPVPGADAPGEDEPAARQVVPGAPQALTGTDQSPARPHRKGQRPVMPGWEDILLGGSSTAKH